MDYFKYFFKCFFRKVPLKVLFILIIFLFLCFICFNANVFAYSDTTDFNLQTYTLFVDDKVYNAIQSYPEFNDNYYFCLSAKGSNSPTGIREYYCSFWYKTDTDSFLYNNADNTNNNVDRRLYFHTSNTAARVYYLRYNGSTDSIEYSEFIGTNLNFLNSNGSRVAHDGIYKLFYITNSTIYVGDSKNTIFYQYVDPYTAPFIVNTTDIDTWSFDNLYISLGSEPYRWTEDGIGYEPTWWELEIIYQDNPYSVRLDDYIYEQEGIDETIFKIPRNVISNSFNLYNGQDITFGLGQYNIHLHNTRFKYYSLDTYTLSLTTAQEEQINNDSEKQVIGNIDNSVTNINNNISNLTDEITNSNVDDFSSDFTDLSTGFEVEDPTSLDEVFMILYNAFCEDDIVNLSFTIPFVNKQVTISSENISARYPVAVTTVVGLFVWGIIGLYVLKDIRSIINKIAEGSPESVGSDVKKEVL